MTSESYTFDLAGNLKTRNADGTVTTYTYDNADQLTGESRTGYVVSYTYDGNGNRLTKTLNGVAESYVYDDGDKLLSAGGKSYTYDAAGRTRTVVASGGTTTLDYDYESRVTSIQYPGGATNTFTYNGLDARVGKSDSAGSHTYRRDGAGVLAPVLADGKASYTPGVSERRNGATSFYHGDQLGSTNRITDAAQAVTATSVYDAFGQTLTGIGSSPTPFGFAGQWGYQSDSDSGLMLLGHRYYDPSTGRFLTRDPVRDGRNWYAYCGNNPFRWVDPDGLRFFLGFKISVEFMLGLELEVGM